MIFLAVAVGAAAGPSPSDVMDKLIRQKGKAETAKWASLAKFLAPASEIRTDTDRINFQKMLLEAKGMSSERAESLAALKSLKQVETKVKLEKWIKRAFRNMMSTLYFKMKNRVDERKAFIKQHQMSSDVRIQSEIKRRWGIGQQGQKGKKQVQKKQVQKKQVQKAQQKKTAAKKKK